MASASKVQDCREQDDATILSDLVPAQVNLELPYLDLQEFPLQYAVPSSHGFYSPGWVKSLIFHHNQIEELPDCFAAFPNLVNVDFSGNRLKYLPDSICTLEKLRILQVKNNRLDADGIPKLFFSIQNLEVLNLSGNVFTELPPQLCMLPKVKALYIGANMLKDLPCAIGDLHNLELLYVGGNQLVDIPATIGRLLRLAALNLSENKLETIPASIACLQRLESLNLHKNQLRTLPPDIVKLRNLRELSLRSNPLVVRFARDITFDPPTLKELAGRTAKVAKLSFGVFDVPATLRDYLSTAHQCVNPKCKGVYFEARVEHVKFVDFCGKYRVPLMQYLCSPTCSNGSPAYCVTSTDSSDSEAEDETRMRRVLLG